MIVISWKKTEKGKLYMCHTDFVIYYKLPEGRGLSISFGGWVFVTVVLPGSWFCGWILMCRRGN